MYHRIVVALVLSLGILAPLVHSKTNSNDVSALNVMYTSLNSDSKLTGWKSSGGSPCDDSWEGITCSGSAVTEINLSGFGLSGSLGYQLSNMKSVTRFDVSKNKLQSEVPYQLPPNVNYLDLSHNGFTGSMPYSISQMTDLEYLNLGSNKISGQLSDIFQKLPKLKTMDLSDNSFSGNLTPSFANLKSLKKLDLSDNQFTGTITVLANLHLDELNVEDNKFTGSIPKELEDIEDLRTGGNNWSGNKPDSDGGKSDHKKKGGGGGGGGGGVSPAIKGLAIALIILGVLVVVVLVIIVFSKTRSKPSSHFLDEERASQRKGFSTLSSQDLGIGLTRTMSKDFKDDMSYDYESSGPLGMKTLQKSPSKAYKPPPADFAQSLNDNEFANRLNSGRSMSVRPIPYSLSELQTATSNFASGRMLGAGSIGRVYRAKYNDGRVLAVKKIDSSIFKSDRPEEFTELISNITKIRHPNIAELTGYCSEQGHNILIYEYYRNGSLHDFLHTSDEYSRPLTWNTRVRIALGTARAIEYLHETLSPSIIHKNIKSPNILLDLELNPRLGDYGLANFHMRTSQNLGAGYNAPECTNPSAYTLKSDVYSFGVVMLELLTGRKPLDNSKPSPEHCLVRWARPQLHDIDALAKMVDPALRGLYPPKSLSQFADIIALCVQEEEKFRPPMSEVVEELVRLVQRTTLNMKDDLTTSRRTEDSDY